MYEGVTTHVFIADSTELAYQLAFEEHWADVFRFALAWTNDWAAAEDLAQEAFLRLWSQRGRLDWERPEQNLADSSASEDSAFRLGNRGSFSATCTIGGAHLDVPLQR